MSTLQRRTAGVGSVFGASSLALTAKAWRPSASDANRTGLVHGVKGAESRLHSNRSSAAATTSSAPVNENTVSGRPFAVPSAGPVEITVSGGLVSTRTTRQVRPSRMCASRNDSSRTAGVPSTTCTLRSNDGSAVGSDAMASCFPAALQSELVAVHVPADVQVVADRLGHCQRDDVVPVQPLDVVGRGAKQSNPSVDPFDHRLASGQVELLAERPHA